MIRFLRANAFVTGIAAVVLAAALAPGIGAGTGPLPVGALKTFGIVAIFFFQGLTLPLTELRRGAGNWRLHLCVQTSTFVFFPLVTLAALAATAGVFTQPDLRLGFLYLALVPTTIASAVALTAAAGGNVGGAIFNTTVSNVGGVFLVPLLCLPLAGLTGAEPSVALGPVLLGICLKILLPLLAGQACRPLLADFAGRHKPFIRRFNSGVILFIIYAAFCESFARDSWSSVPLPLLAGTLAGVVLLLAAAHGFVWWYAGRLGLDPPSRIAALMCGGQKTLAVGLPLAVMIFGDASGLDLGLLLLPLLLYHAAQLLLAGWLAPRLAARTERSP